MGFTALVIAKPPCFMDENSLAYGPSSFDGTYKCSGKLDKEIELLGRSLSIKPHVFAWNVSENQSKQRKTMSTVEDKEKRQVIYLSFFTEVHVGKFEEFEQLKSY
jgi:ribosome-binding ATPase YchF (GTP1/OBG family)